MKQYTLFTQGAIIIFSLMLSICTANAQQLKMNQKTCKHLNSLYKKSNAGAKWSKKLDVKKENVDYIVNQYNAYFSLTVSSKVYYMDMITDILVDEKLINNKEKQTICNAHTSFICGDLADFYGHMHGLLNTRYPSPLLGEFQTWLQHEMLDPGHALNQPSGLFNTPGMNMWGDVIDLGFETDLFTHGAPYSNLNPFEAFDQERDAKGLEDIFNDEAFNNMASQIVNLATLNNSAEGGGEGTNTDGKESTLSENEEQLVKDLFGTIGALMGWSIGATAGGAAGGASGAAAGTSAGGPLIGIAGGLGGAALGAGSGGITGAGTGYLAGQEVGRMVVNVVKVYDEHKGGGVHGGTIKGPTPDIDSKGEKIEKSLPHPEDIGGLTGGTTKKWRDIMRTDVVDPCMHNPDNCPPIDGQRFEGSRF